MKRAPHRRTWVITLGIPFAWLCCVRPARAQLGVRELGVGYVVNAPELMLGFTAHAMTASAGGLGVFVDVKLDIDSPGDEPTFFAGETAQQVAESTDHVFYQSDDGFLSLSAGLMRPLVGERLVVYAGAGYTQRTRFNEYLDRERQRGRAGFYWVEDPERSGGELNLLAGLMLSLAPRVRVRMGVERIPAGVTIGGLFVIPLR